MSLDPLLPIAPARVKALLLPVGQIKADRFASFVDRLAGEHVVHLRDISADGRPNRNMFSPLAYPEGAMLYDLITHMPPPSHLALTPFDLYREPMTIIALADGKEMEATTFSKRHSAHGTGSTMAEKNLRALYQELEDLRDNYPKALIHQVLIFDYIQPSTGNTPMPEGIYDIPPVENSKRTTIKTVMCDISSHLLAEMTTLAKSFEAMTTIESPVPYSETGKVNGGWDAGDGTNGLTRRNSQHSLANGRSASASVADRAQTRMSMPPVPSRPSINHSTSAPGRRPSTPVRGGLPNNQVLSDGTASDAGSDSSTPDQPASRPDSASGLRDVAKRVSVQGFGPGGANDRWRLRSKGRAAVVIGSMYLQAGRWSDSLKELSEGATAARSLNDHIWHGKALELILMNLFLLGWSGLEFQIPAVCFSTEDQKKSSKNDQPAEVPGQPKHLRNLQAIIPDLLDRILNLYSRKRAESEKLPKFPFSEATIRFCRVLVALHRCGGVLGKEALDMIVTGKTPGKELTTSPRLTITPTRQHIVNTLFDAFPASHSFASDLLTTVDRVSILSGIAAILGSIGYHRKKAMVIRELVSVLITGLVEGRTRGAADAGVHPASGVLSMIPANSNRAPGVALDLTEGDIEQGIEAFLELLCRSYGIVGYKSWRSAETSGSEDHDSNEAVTDRIKRQDASRFFGFLSIKLNILRACINFSEALPDLNGVLKFSSDLLRTAGSGVAPGPRREDVTPVIYPEEQARLLTNISRTSHLALRLGMPASAAEYWDEFLVRGMILEPLPARRAPIPHAPSVLPGAVAERASQDVDPFIYNPFLKKPNDVLEQFLVAGELATFRITMQNPYDMEVEIESIRLETTGIGFEALPETTRIGPNRSLVMRLKGRPTEKGQVDVTGAIVKVRGCRERRFPIFTHSWLPARDAKIKGKGLPTLEDRQAPVRGTVATLQPDRLSLNAIQAQPLLNVKCTSLAQSSIMILEGERQIFSITLQNQSSTPVDFMLFSFKDSTQAPLQSALNKRDATPAELHEYELILMKKQALRIPRGSQRRNIDAGGEATFEFEILGKPGLTSATVQIDYTHLGVPREEVSEQFYTRQVSVDLMVTVNAGVEVTRVDALPIQGEIPRPLWTRLGLPDIARDVSDYCLLSMDLRNIWPGHMMVQIGSDDGMTLEEGILPGNTARLIVPIKRVFLEDPHASIPSLNPSKERQFVVSTSKISPEVERSNREAFWYREKILQSLSASWRTVSGHKRTGTLELRNLRLTPRMVEVVKVDEVGIDISVESESGPRPGAVAFVDEFMQVNMRITNKTNRPISSLVRLMPALRNRPTNVAIDYTRKLAWNGTLQQLVPQLQGKESIDVRMGMTALCRGEFELTATVEEVELWDDPDEDERSRGEGRQRSGTQTALDAALGAKERRIWHSRQPFIWKVKDKV